MPSERQKYVSFLIRIWQEPREIEGQGFEWRGSIENIQTGHKGYFKDLETLLKFTREQLDTLGLSPEKRRKYIV